MHLEKFYVDVVTEDGGGCIGYAARLQGFGLKATLAATLRWRADTFGPALQRRTARGVLPTVSNGALEWRCPALGVEGTWSAAPGSRAESRTLWNEGDEFVTWEVLQPRGSVELRISDEKLHGWGYAERLVVTATPSRLPIDALRWGRFVSPQHSVVWIEWEHRSPRRWLLHDGVDTSASFADGSRVTWPGSTLTLTDTRVLRSGRLADTAFLRWRPIKGMLPQRITSMQESKWCSAGALTTATGATAQGWAIHERVQFR